MRAFRQHDFTPVVSLGTMPNIQLSPLAFEKMFHITNIAKLEVGWFGAVSEPRPGLYLIEDIFLLKQRVGDATNELDPGGLAQLCTDICNTYPGDRGMEMCGQLKFWGHSHVNFGVLPSKQDQDQTKEFRENENLNYLIRGIANKKGDLRFTFFDYENEIVVDDVPWSMQISLSEERARSIMEEMRQKVKEIPTIKTDKWYSNQIKKADRSGNTKLKVQILKAWQAQKEYLAEEAAQDAATIKGK